MRGYSAKGGIENGNSNKNEKKCIEFVEGTLICFESR